MPELLPLFEWLDSSWLATAAKAYGGTFAVVQMVHLLGLALLGGAVLLSDLRLLGLLGRSLPFDLVMREAHRWLGVALVLMVLSGIFMSSAVALKLYYSEMYWAKMAALALGFAFAYGVRYPLLRRSGEALKPATRYLLGSASLGLWLTVAATGRWIGFS